jgi:hypothetical protein
VPSERPRSFAEFWPLYLNAHSRAGTRGLHYLGTLLALGSMAAALALRDWRLAVLAPLLGYGLAWLGHFGLERNRPATFGHPLWSFAADFRMLGLALSGRLRDHLDRGD